MEKKKRAQGKLVYGSIKKLSIKINIILLITAVSLFTPAFILTKELIVLIFMILFAAIPILNTVLTCRFCVKYDANEKKIYYRNLFKFREIAFGDIQRIIKNNSSLIIYTGKTKLSVPVDSCEGAEEFEAFLRRHVKKKF